MALTSGTRLGPYAITARIGVGGMGEVYRATDTTLDRQVAIKVLPESLASDAERIARFEREAKTLASLNHPNIATVYGFEKSSGVHALVMELVEGPTLADRIAKGAIPVDDALPIAKQIAEALETAHEQGIIHRDLKPANVKLRPDGVVKVLDFGLAKALEPTGAMSPGLSQSPTITTPAMTRAGMILGTAAYMSPEQARGKPVDRRSDIWALGCVLYEMLTGRHTFPGEDVTDILGAVLHKEPDWTALPETTSASIRTLLRRCLQKDKDRRSRDAAEIRLQIEETLTAPATETPSVRKAAPPTPLLRRAMPLVLASLVVGAIIAGLTVWNLRPTPVPRPISRLAVQLPPGDRIEVSLRPLVAISPDGSHVVYAGSAAGGQLNLRRLDSPEIRPIPGTQGGSNPFFSPDGQWLGFFASQKLMKVALSGGPALTLCDALQVWGATWGPDDTIVFSGLDADGRSRLFEVPAAGGMPTALTQPASAGGAFGHAWPEFLPGGNTLLFTSATSNSMDNAQIEALNLESGERRVLVQGGTYPRYAPTGHLVYHRDGALMAVPFDPDRVEVTGAPAPVLEGVMSSLTAGGVPTGSGVAQFGFSRTGSLVYLAGGAQADERTLVWVDRTGAVEPLVAPPRAYVHPALITGRQTDWRQDYGRNDRHLDLRHSAGHIDAADV